MLYALPLLIMSAPAESFRPAASSRAEYLRLAAEVRENLEHHVLAQWFPRSLAETGFAENFNADWSAGDPEPRSLVYQARLTWVSAQVAHRTSATSSVAAGNVEHGITELERFWDHEHGGLYWNGSRTGFPHADKHVYGMAFAIYAASAAHPFTSRALSLAQRTFGWLEKHAHDPVNGGYYEALDDRGTPILGAEVAGHRDWPHRTGTDAIGTEFGLKSMNTHIHLLEALSALYAVWPDTTVKRRLLEVFKLVRDRVVDPKGFQFMFFKPDWQPVGEEDSYGHDIETAYLLTEAAETLHIPNDRRTWATARRIADHTLAVGWDTEFGGVYDHGPRTASPSDPKGQSKVWWVQAEALNSFLMMHAKYGRSTRRYWDAFVREWDFIQEHQVDHRYGGWRRDVSRDGTPPPNATKSDGWTEAYHQGRALMNVERRLIELAARG